MNWIFIGFSIPTLLLYVGYSRQERTYLNALTGPTALKFAIEFALEPIAYNLGIFNYNVQNFFQLYLASFIAYLFFVLGAIPRRKRKLGQVKSVFVPKQVPWLFLLFAVLLFVPVLVEFRDSLLDPRYIYEKTRTGYGIQFFGSAIFANISLVLFLLSNRRYHWLFLVLLICFTLLKGSKGQLLTIMLIYAVWAVYVRKIRFDVKSSLTAVALVACIIVGAFTLSFRGEIESLILSVAGYSDYNRNASLVLADKGAVFEGGRLSFEDFVYSKVPRSVWPEKPKNFGAFFLAEKYYPEWFMLEQGAPSFGIGIYFADFGFFAFPIIAFVNLLNGFLLRYFIMHSQHKITVTNFIMILFFSGAVLMPVGAGYFLIEHLILAVILQKVVSVIAAPKPNRACA